MRESTYQAGLIRKISKLLPDCLILKNDSGYMQGILDLTVFYEDRYAMLEVKISADAPHQPNQDYYVEHVNRMSFAAFIYPENEREVLRALQAALQPQGRSLVS